MRARAVEDPHFSQEPMSDNRDPSFSCDYAFPSSHNTSTGVDEKVTVFVAKEHGSRYLAATVVPYKGANDETSWSSTYFATFIESLGYKNTSVVLKSDGEPAISAVLQSVTEARTAPTRVEHSPKGSSQSNGSAENAVRKIESHMRTLRLALENRYGVRISVNHNVIPFLTSHAAFCINRF